MLQPSPHHARRRRRLLASAALSMLACLGIATPARGQAVFGTNTGTFADWLPSYGMDQTPQRGFGNPSNPYQYDPNVQLPNGSVVANGQSVSYMNNYPAGTYTISWDSAQPTAISAGGGFGSAYNVTRVGTHNTEQVNFSSGFSYVNASGASTANPITNLAITRPGGTIGGFTPTFTAATSAYSAMRWMNNLNINDNTATMSAKDLVPSGSNFGVNSTADITRFANAQPNLKSIMVEIPVNADDSYIAAFAKSFNTLAPGKQLIVELANENWNGGFKQLATIQQQAYADGRVNAGDDFGKIAQEAGLKAAHMMQVFQANTGLPASQVAGFLGSQGSTTYFVDQGKAAIDRVFGSGTVNKLFKYQGISFYPGDGLTGASSTTDLYNQMEADIARQTGYLTADRNDAKASGLNELVYEWSPNGYLTRGGVSQSLIDAFRADPRSKQLTLDIWNAINNNIGANGMAFSFDVEGDGWSTQVDPLKAAEYEQQAILQISAALGVNSGGTGVGGGTPVPEPTTLGLLGLTALGLLRRRRGNAGRRAA